MPPKTNAHKPSDSAKNTDAEYCEIDEVKLYHPDMDREEHEKTYRHFVQFSQTSTAFIINILLALLMVGVIGFGFVFALLFVLAALIVYIIGLFLGKGGWKASAALFALGALLVAVVSG